MIILEWLRFAVAALLLLGGMITLIATAIGIFRFKYVLNRIHAAAKCDTFGILLTFLSLIVMLGWSTASLKLLLIIVFLWIANPLAGHLIAQLEVTTNPNVKGEYKVQQNAPD